jgi:hypothetical protein
MKVNYSTAARTLSRTLAERTRFILMCCRIWIVWCLLNSLTIYLCQYLPRSCNSFDYFMIISPYCMPFGSYTFLFVIFSLTIYLGDTTLVHPKVPWIIFFLPKRSKSLFSRTRILLQLKSNVSHVLATFNLDFQISKL